MRGGLEGRERAEWSQLLDWSRYHSKFGGMARHIYQTNTIYNKVPSGRLKSAAATEAMKRFGGSEHSSRIVAFHFVLRYSFLQRANLRCACMQA